MRQVFASCLRFNHPTGSTISRLFKPSPKKIGDILLLHLDTKYDRLEIWLGYFAITYGYTKCIKYDMGLNMFYSYFSGYTSSIWIWDRLNDYTFGITTGGASSTSTVRRSKDRRTGSQMVPLLVWGRGAKLAQLQKDFDGFSVQMPRWMTGATCHKHSWEHGTRKNLFFFLEFWRCIVSQFDFKGVCQHLKWFFPFWPGYGNQMKEVSDVQTAPFQSNPAMVSMFLKAFRLRDYTSQ